jgi:hypothetical protein
MRIVSEGFLKLRELEQSYKNRLKAYEEVTDSEVSDDEDGEENFNRSQGYGKAREVVEELFDEDLGGMGDFYFEDSEFHGASSLTSERLGSISGPSGVVRGASGQLVESKIDIPEPTPAILSFDELDKATQSTSSVDRTSSAIRIQELTPRHSEERELENRSPNYSTSPIVEIDHSPDLSSSPSKIAPPSIGSRQLSRRSMSVTEEAAEEAISVMHRKQLERSELENDTISQLRAELEKVSK